MKKVKPLYTNYWLSLYQTPKGFVYAQRKGINSTASLCFRLNKKGQYEFLIRYQPLPVIHQYSNKKENTLYPCCITGSIEQNESPLQNCLKEVFEESGYKIKQNNIKHVISASASTQMNEIVFHYLVDLTNVKKQGKEQNDGSYFESVSKNKWVSEKTLNEILSNEEGLFLSCLGICYLAFITKLKNNNNL